MKQKHYSEARDVDTIARVQSEVDDLKNVMVQNIGTCEIFLAIKGTNLRKWAFQ